jgi:four helix bundle protein
MAIRSFRDLEVYQESLQLAKEVNQLVKTFPKEKKFLLIDQAKRASRAVSSLIAEGWAKRRQIKEFRKYLRDALGEANEMINHLEQSRLFSYIANKTAKELIERYDRVAAKLVSLKSNWQTF